MPTPILATKLYIPPPREKVVSRPRLVERLKDGSRLTLISAPAGFGKTSLISEWLISERLTGHSTGGKASQPRAAWLSLDEGDNDPARFLAYLVAALRTAWPGVGAGVLAALESPQLPPVELLLTNLLNELAAAPREDAPRNGILVLDDFHAIDAMDGVVTFLVEHLPPQMRLVIATREDPRLPLARLRARGQLTELRAADLRFTPAEAAEFLNRVMGLTLPPEEIAALEARTEGWIAGLQLAALALQGSGPGQADTAEFVRSFTGSHRFVLDYLMEEVLHRQPESVQTFLLLTCVLERFCAGLCEAVIGEEPLLRDSGLGNSLFVIRKEKQPFQPDSRSDETRVDASLRDASLRDESQMDVPALLDYLERSNLFIVPLDHERRWYRYHHLFGDLLRQRLEARLKSAAPEATAPQVAGLSVAALHIRASQWYEDNSLAFEAFHHAAAANDIDRAERLVENKGLPLHASGAMTKILGWLGSLPEEVLDARPFLRARYAALLLVTGQTTGVEDKLDAAEANLRGLEQTAHVRDRLGQVSAARATLALTRYQPENIITHAHRALELLDAGTYSFRTTALWALGNAYVFLGKRAEASAAFTEAIAVSEASGSTFSRILILNGLGYVQETQNQLHLAVETLRRSLQLFGDQPLPAAADVHLGLGRIAYEWNDLEAAERHGRQSLELAHQYDRVIDRFIISEVFLARLMLARGDVDGAAAALAETEQLARRKNFVQRLPEAAAALVTALLRQGRVAEAAQMAEAYHLPAGKARVLLAQGRPSAALAILEALRQAMEAGNLEDERLRAIVLLAVAYAANGEKEKALAALSDALALAEPEGFLRTFIDEGAPMTALLQEAAARGIQPEYTARLLAAFGMGTTAADPYAAASTPVPSALVEALSSRELEVLRLIAEGLSNQAIGERLYLALDTVKGHARRIYDKLGVQRRTEAVARARELKLL